MVVRREPCQAPLKASHGTWAERYLRAKMGEEENGFVEEHDHEKEGL